MLSITGVDKDPGKPKFPPAPSESGKMSSAAQTPLRTFRELYACRLTREKIFQELVAPHEGNKSPRLAPGLHDLLPDTPVPTGPHDLPKDLAPSPGEPRLKPLKVCIVGAGAAGLFIAMILSRLGIQYDLFEASGRVGGRMFTKRFGDNSNEDHDYYDIGAMRYPDIPPMKLAFFLFRYLNIPLIPYFLEGENCPAMYNDILGPPPQPEFDYYRVSRKNKGVVPDGSVEAGVTKLLDAAYEPYKKLLRKDFEAGFEKLMTVDKYSTREYLRSHHPHGYESEGTCGLDFHTIQWLETNSTASGLFDQSFAESVLDSLDFDYGPNVNWYCIDGGTSRVAKAMCEKIATQPQLNKAVTRIAINREDGSSTTLSIDLNGSKHPEKYDTVFNTTTLACAQRMDLVGAELHSAQKDALRGLHYDASSKVAIKFKTPWWITKCGITKAGSASCDLPLRTCVYPSYSIHDDPEKPAVLMVSYCWAQDAQRIASLIQPDSPAGEDELKELMLRDIARLHEKSGITSEYLHSQYLTHHAFDWYHDPYTSGAFAIFGPGQFSNLYTYLTRPAADGKLHFVGEASSTHHAWIAGALQSALRAVIYSFLRFGMRDEVQEVQDCWGTVGEVELGENGTAHLQVILGCLKPEGAGGGVSGGGGDAGGLAGEVVACR